MAEEAKEPVKQEGDFKIKSKPKSKKPKQLTKSDKEVAKIDLSKPEAQGEIQPAVAHAKNDLTKLKDQYYAEIKNRPGANPEQQKATDFFNRYNKQQETIKQSQEIFQKRTNDLFGSEFKGFDYSVGDKNFRYKVKDPGRVAEAQSNIENFVNKFIDNNGNISDAAGYHKALYAAMNAVPPLNPAEIPASISSKSRAVDLSKNNMFSSIAPCVSKFLRIPSKSPIPVAAENPTCTLPLSSIAANKP